MDRADSLGDHADGGLDSPAPVWAVFGDLMAGLLGAFVLILVLVIGVQLELASQLEAEVQQRQAEQQRRQTLEEALAGPLAGGRVTLANGRIGISGSVLFADGSDQLQPAGRQLLASLAAPLAGHRVDQAVLLVPAPALPLAGPRTGPLSPRSLGLHSSRLGVMIIIMRRR